MGVDFLDLDRFCLPSGEEVTNGTTWILETYFSDGLTKYMGDLVTCYWLFLVMAAVAFVISFLYLFLLRCIAKPLLYISFVLILLLLAGGGLYVWMEKDNYNESDNTYTVMKWMAILLWILTGIYFCILLCCCSRIRLGIAIIEATSEFVQHKFQIFLIPIVFFLIIVVWIAYWVISAVYVYSVGDVVQLG